MQCVCVCVVQNACELVYVWMFVCVYMSLNVNAVIG